MHTGTEKEDLSLAQEFKYHLEEEHRQNGTIDQGKSGKYSSKETGQKENIMFRIMLGIDLCYNTFSRIDVQHQHYPEHHTVCLYIFFPLIVYCFLT